MERVCFQLQVRPNRLEEYAARHAAVWPEMLRALASAGWHNYSLFLNRAGLLIGYFETPDLRTALDGMERADVNRRWQDDMAEFFEDLGDARPDTGFHRLIEVFHLEDQLSTAAANRHDKD